MERVFLTVLNMSLTACWVIAAVVAVRLLLRRAPKKYSYWLWSVVGFRLCCPVSFQSAFSLFRLRPLGMASAASAAVAGTSAMEFIPGDVGLAPQPRINVGVPAVSEAVSASLPAATPQNSANPMQVWIFLGMLVWLIGAAALLVYAVISYLKLCRRMDMAVAAEEENVYESDRVRSPFLLGLRRPKIYIPFGLDGDTRRYVLEHERYHIRRRDDLVKAFAFLLLSVHWFNPLAWLAFRLMGRDMEMSCDEQVLAGGQGDKKPYSMALLGFALENGRRFPTPGPLAFGESDVKRRIKNVLNWKRPRTWVTVAAALLVLVSVAAFAANPAKGPSDRRLKSDAWALARSNAQYAGVTVERDKLRVERSADGSEIRVCYPITGEIYQRENGVEIRTVQDPFAEDNPRYVVTYEFLQDDLTEPYRVTAGTLEGPTPWVWAHTVKAEDVELAQGSSYLGDTPGRFELTEAQVEALTALLNNVSRDEVTTGRGIPARRSLTVRCGTAEYLLRFDGGIIELAFDSETAALYPIEGQDPVWEIHSDALYAFLDGLTA